MIDHTTALTGTTYLVEHLRDGAVIGCEQVHNLIPTEGLNHIVDVVIRRGTQATGWYIGLFEGNYTPAATDTAGTFPTQAVECTAYAPANRPAFTYGALSGGVVDNTNSRAEFTFTGGKTIYGAFLAPAPTKGAPTAPLLSAARFVDPKVVVAGDILRVTATFEAASGT